MRDRSLAAFQCFSRHMRTQTGSDATSHVVVICVVLDVTHEQDDRLVSHVLPPMRSAAGLRSNVAGLVCNRNRAVARIFDDLAFRDVNDCGTISVAVPGHDAAWLNSELAEAKLAFFDVCRFFFKIDSCEHGVGYT